MDTYALQIATHLQNAGVGLTIGVNLFIDHMPPEAEDCVVLYTDSGSSQDMYLDTRHQNISLWSRSIRGDVAVSNLEKALLVLHRLDNITIGNYYLYFCYAISGIMGLDTDNRRRRIYKVTFNTIYRDTNVIS